MPPSPQCRWPSCLCLQEDSSKNELWWGGAARVGGHTYVNSNDFGTLQPAPERNMVVVRRLFICCSLRSEVTLPRGGDVHLRGLCSSGSSCLIWKCMNAGMINMILSVQLGPVDTLSSFGTNHTLRRHQRNPHIDECLNYRCFNLWECSLRLCVQNIVCNV